MLQSILNTLFGCSHRHTTFPLTPTRKSAGQVVPTEVGMYVTCLDCGKELAYNWEEMRVGKPVSGRGRTAEAQPSFR